DPKILAAAPRQSAEKGMFTNASPWARQPHDIATGSDAVPVKSAVEPRASPRPAATAGRQVSVRLACRGRGFGWRHPSDDL
ncbi:MAG: hypothetical protein ACK53L_29680, partial [Pirellulaceae bacterium]